MPKISLLLLPGKTLWGLYHLCNGNSHLLQKSLIINLHAPNLTNDLTPAPHNLPTAKINNFSPRRIAPLTTITNDAPRKRKRLSTMSNRMLTKPASR
jgi:hypothetical protein